MWFDDGKQKRRKRRRKSNKRLTPTHRVTTRGKKRKKADASRMAAFLVVPLLVLTAGLLLWFGIKVAGEMLFSRNPAFTINRLIVKSESPVTEEYIRGKKGIREGTNLFSFSSSDVRAEFLRGAPNFKSMDITRILPDTLSVVVAERVPLAAIGRRGGFVVDHEGFVFGPKVRKQNLPVIVGYRGPLLRPGDRIEGIAAEAVKILSLCDTTALGADLVISGIDISGGFTGKEDDMQLHLAGETIVDFWWPRRGPKGYSPANELRGRLEFLRGVLNRAAKEGLRPRTINVALETYEENCPVVFWD